MGYQVILSPNQIRAESYGLKKATVDKYLQRDGSITTRDGTVVLPPNPIRAADYMRKSAQVAKWVLEDGSISTEPYNYDTRFVSLSADQEINGSKTFTQSPHVPDPLNNMDVANKGYVDSRIEQETADIDGGEF